MSSQLTLNICRRSISSIRTVCGQLGHGSTRPTCARGMAGGDATKSDTNATGLAKVDDIVTHTGQVMFFCRIRLLNPVINGVCFICVEIRSR